MLGCPWPSWLQGITLTHHDIGLHFNGWDYAGHDGVEHMFGEPAALARDRRAMAKAGGFGEDTAWRMGVELSTILLRVYFSGGPRWTLPADMQAMVAMDAMLECPLRKGTWGGAAWALQTPRPKQQKLESQNNDLATRHKERWFATIAPQSGIAREDAEAA